MTEKRAARDEGAAQTKQIVEAVKRRRLAKVPTWSAERLAEEMTKVGVPWNADVVVNLEHGRRKSLRVHELLALAWVLEVASPVDLLAAEGSVDMVWVTPEQRASAETVRAWFKGETGPLRHHEKSLQGAHEVGEMVGDAFNELVRRGYTKEEAGAWLSEILRGRVAADGGGDDGPD